MTSKGKGRSKPSLKLYAHALPLLPTSYFPTHPSSPTSILSLILNPTSIENPRCTGIFDPASWSVWIVNRKDTEILWRRGFFGKGNLSRSEPSWRERRENAIREAGKGCE